LEIAALAPDRVAALVLIGTKATRRPDPDFLASALETIREKGLTTAWHEMWEPLFSDKTSPRAVNDAKRIALLQSSEDVARGVAAFHMRPSRDDVLSTFPGPVIVVTGSDDIAPGLKTSAKQAEMARHGRLHIIPECGHYVPMEQPAAINSVLREVIVAYCTGNGIAASTNRVQ
jgi:pimeloyl-ACP methyl ester carboxylesterase